MSFCIDAFNADWLDAWSRKDVDRLVSFYAPDTVYKDPQTAAGLTGREALRGYLTGLFGATPPMVYTPHETWPIPGGGSPDMGNVSADGRQLWLSGRYDDAVYVFDTTTGSVKTIKVGMEPHGLTVWPQPGRYSLGHTGNMR